MFAFAFGVRRLSVIAVLQKHNKVVYVIRTNVLKIEPIIE